VKHSWLSENLWLSVTPIQPISSLVGSTQLLTLLNSVALQIFNVAFLCRQPHSFQPHDLIFIASIPKLSPRPALVFVYSTPSFKASKDLFNRIAASGYVSVSVLSFANDFRGVSSKLQLLP
jgi:hypothetical protein